MSTVTLSGRAAAELVQRALLLWLPIRTLMLIGALAVRLDPRLVPVGYVVAALVTAGMCMVDARSMKESVFNANLGTPTWAPAAVGAAVAVAVELGIALLYPLAAGAG